MQNFLLAEPFDSGSFTEVGTVAAGRGADKLVDGRAYEVARFTNLNDAGYTYDLGASRPSAMIPTLGALLYGSFSPYTNLQRHPRDVTQADYATSNVSKVETAVPTSFPSPGRHVLGDTGLTNVEYKVYQAIASPFSGHGGTLARKQFGEFVESLGGWGGCVFCTRAFLGGNGSSGWVQLALDKSVGYGATFYINLNLDTGEIGNVGQGTAYGVKAAANGMYELWIAGRHVDYADDLRASIGLLSTSQGRVHSTGGSRVVKVDGWTTEVGRMTPGKFVDNGAVRAPLVRYALSSSTGSWNIVTTSKLFCPATDVVVVDNHGLGFFPDTDVMAETARYARFTIDDPDNVAGRVDVGRQVVAQALQPALNAEWGIRGPFVREATRRAVRSALRADRKRWVQLTHSDGEAEARRFKELYERVGSSGQVLFSRDPESDTLWRDLVFGQVQSFEQADPHWGRVTTTLTVEEESETRVT